MLASVGASEAWAEIGNLVTAVQAASEIIRAVHENEWRVLVGDDAKAVDAYVRANPLAAYEQP